MQSQLFRLFRLRCSVQYMSSLKNVHGPVAPDAARAALVQLNAILEDRDIETVPVTVGRADAVVDLPPGMASVLRAVLSNFAAGNSVGVLPMHAELTTQQAADILNVSRPHIVKLMDAGELPMRKVGTHRRILAADLAEYQHRRDLETKQAADELSELTEEMGLY